MSVRPIHVALLAVELAAVTALAQGTPPWQPLAGEWKLNSSLSDAKPSDERDEEGRPPRRGGGAPQGGEMGGGPGGPGGFGGGPGGGGMRGGPGGGPGGGRGGPDGKDRGNRPPALGGEKSLLIGLEPAGLRVSAGGESIRILAVDGPPVERKRGPLTVTETVTWETGALLVRAKAAEGPSTTEGFAVGEDGRLVHTVTLPARGGGEERTLRWVYDRVEAKGKKK
jgi:hypothetical protein